MLIDKYNLFMTLFLKASLLVHSTVALQEGFFITVSFVFSFFRGLD